ncbi:hypothetical protein LJC17_04800 [Acholeplasma sp. OttesenSCG-928-E16]|nr:hypothetical protein [Acholeplasma sp. OttesenSCG-928-E16]
MEPNDKVKSSNKTLRIQLISMIVTIFMMIGFGIGFGPIYVLWTFLGSFVVTLNFTFMIRIGIKNKELIFFVIMIIVKLLIYGGIVFLVSFITKNDMKAFISLAVGFSALIVSIPIHFLIVAIRKEEVL